MRHAQSIAAVRLVLPEFGRRKVRLIRSQDGVVNLKRRAWMRAFSLWLRPVNYIALAVSLIVMFAGENAAAVPYILLFGLFVFALEKGAAAPKRRRGARLVRDVRPILLQSVIQLPETKRAGRIVRAQPEIELPALPPDRPRTRISERRPGPYEEAYD
ncbi:MAG: hypothetical protein C0519_07815 [Hyphomicrobium sp.]|nr:hypothetical protein [Hyphomicrobium sp.]PPD07025.1 MAG: hypothetical protein CTY28_11030 [Hyphomicrobium sp.]